MALIDCPECGRQVSSIAAACPECAYPVAAKATPPAPQQARAGGEPPKERWWKLALSIVARLVLGMGLVGAGLGEDEPSGVVGGLVIAGSVIPTWYRSKMMRWKGGRGPKEIDDRLENRLDELEQRHRDELRQLQQIQAGQIADLEERIDFAERLLTRNREQIGPG